ncbi:MAG TPA: hypothetical protein VLM83_09165 [Anaerolineales bacterium]|nr:hypothetical protein [Anaerolineales bacterium]
MTIKVNNVKHKKLKYGLSYGLVGGVAFAIFAWGVDALLLTLAHATYPWIKFIPGLIICALAGGLVGWLTIRFENHLIALLLWLLLAVLFSWLVVWLPLTGAPGIIKLLDPELATRFDFSQVQDIYQFRLVGLLAIGLAASISGLLEINLVENALLAPSGFTHILTLLVCLILFGVGGSSTDHLINTNFREPIQAVDKLIQFAADNEGKEVPSITARAMHLSAVKDLDEYLQSPRKLSIIAFDPPLGMMNILVDFDGPLVQCTAIYSQPTNCVILSATP